MADLTQELLSIREVRPEEFQRLHEIDQICFPAYMAYSRAELLFFLKRPATISRVAELAGCVAGFAIGHVEREGCAHVITLDVLPEARRCRVGTALMATLHAEFRRRGVTRVLLEVAAHNEAAQQFYARLGYTQRELLHGYYQGRADAYRMLLLL